MKTTTIHLPLNPVELPHFQQHASTNHLVTLDIIRIRYIDSPIGEMGAEITGDDWTVNQFIFHTGRLIGIYMGASMVRQTIRQTEQPYVSGREGEVTNAERAEVAYRCLSKQVDFDQQDIEGGITDLMVNLLHLCDEQGIDAEAMMYRCAKHYTQEVSA